MLAMKSVVDGIVNWLAANARSFNSYMLPDSLEPVLYPGIAAYFVAQLTQQQA